MADLRYGVALYEYYQGNYFEALSELMVAQARGGIKGHGDNPDLIAGGISLSFGLENRASRIFNNLLASDGRGDSTRPEQVRNAAWFYLARLRYLRGDWDGSDASLDEIAGDLDPELLPEVESTAISLAIRRNDLAAAESGLGALRYARDQRHYLYYNLANAYTRARNLDKAAEYYRKLAALPFSDDPALREEQLAVYDKAMTAAGYLQLLQGQHRQAVEQFARVRLESPFSNRALLGYGWAAVENKDYELALKPWQVLGERPLVFAAAQEARIALPYAYEQLGAQGQALDAYLNAEEDFAAEIQRIDGLIGELDQMDVIAALNISGENNPNWFLLGEGSAATPEMIYLAELFANTQFQTAIQELRDLLQMAQRLEQWQEKLDAYQHMLDLRENNRGLQVQAIARRQLSAKLAGLQSQRDRLAQSLARIVSDRDYFALAPEEERELAGIAANAADTIALLKQAGQDTQEYEELLRRYRGLLTWEASQAFPERRWQVRRALRKLDAAIAEAQSNLRSLDGVIVEAPDIEPYRSRIARLLERLDAEQQRLNVALGRAEDELRSRVTGELIAHRGRLQEYRAQARLSVARLYDRAAQGGQP